jgi:hypothetical protein
VIHRITSLDSSFPGEEKMDFMEPMDISPEAKRLELIKELVKFYDKALPYNSTSWKDVSMLVVAAVAGRKPECYGFPRSSGAYQHLKDNPKLLEEVKHYVNGYGKVMF